MSEDTETTAGEKAEGGQMSLIAHLTELRNRLGVALLAFVVLFLLCVAPMPGGGGEQQHRQPCLYLSSGAACRCP